MTSTEARYAMVQLRLFIEKTCAGLAPSVATETQYETASRQLNTIADRLAVCDQLEMERERVRNAHARLISAAARAVRSGKKSDLDAVREALTGIA